MSQFHRRMFLNNTVIVVLIAFSINSILGVLVEVTRSQDGDVIKLLETSTPCSFFDAMDEPDSPGYCRCRTNDMVPKAGTFMNKCVYDMPSETRMFVFLFYFYH